MKAFIGLNNISSVFFDIKNGLNRLGVKTLTVSKYHSPSVIIKDYSDFNIPKWKSYAPKGRPHRFTDPFKPWWDRKVDEYIFNKAVKECDIFIFICESFKEDFSDLKVLRELKKKIFFVFVGDDVRWYHAMKQEFLMYGLRPLEYDTPEIYSKLALQTRLSRIRNAEKNADFIFSRLDQGQLQLKPYFRWNMIVSPKLFKNRPTQRLQPVIVHAPSSRSIKGTRFILEAFEKLKAEGEKFTISLIENVPHEQAIKMYQDADIVIDQLLCPGSGKLASEALASGKIVLANMSYKNYPQNNPPDCPIIDVNPETIYDVLKKIISDITFRTEHAKKGRPYVEKYLDVSHFCKKVISLANGYDEVGFDYYPDFFRNKYIPVDQEELLMMNDWTETMRNEAWYQQYVPKGERDGLIF